MDRENLDGVNRPFVTDRSDPTNAINDSEHRRAEMALQRWIKREHQVHRDPKFNTGYWPGYRKTEIEQ